MITIDFNMSSQEVHDIVIPLGYKSVLKGERTFIVLEDIKYIMSDGREIIVEKGFETDLASVPAWLWSLFKPIDCGFAGDLLHDKLWVSKIEEIQYHKNIHKARKFADSERLKWRKKFAPNHKVKNMVTHLTVRIVGSLMYSGQVCIPD